MRLDCPDCGEKGDSKVTKTPRSRCSPASGNGGYGYEWDDHKYNDPDIDYRGWNLLDSAKADAITEMGAGDVA